MSKDGDAPWVVVAYVKVLQKHVCTRRYVSAHARYIEASFIALYIHY